jgi:hypothetical protein
MSVYSAGDSTDNRCALIGIAVRLEGTYGIVRHEHIFLVSPELYVVIWNTAPLLFVNHSLVFQRLHVPQCICAGC